MSDSLKHNFEEIVWHDKKARDRGGVRAVITSNACGSSVCWRQGPRSHGCASAGATRGTQSRIFLRRPCFGGGARRLSGGRGCDHYRIVRGALYKGLSAASELG